jgi:hypothetical protein
MYIYLPHESRERSVIEEMRNEESITLSSMGNWGWSMNDGSAAHRDCKMSTAIKTIIQFACARNILMS